MIGAALPVPDVTHTLSQIEGAVKRVATRMPVANRARLRRLERFVKRFLNLHFSQDRFSADEMFDFDSWIDNTPYTVKRKTELRAVHENSLCSVVNSKIKAFTKDENYTEYKFHRGIYSRDDDYKVRVGPFFKKFGDRLFKSPWFIKKIPIPDRPKAMAKKLEKFMNKFMTDFSSFEATFGTELMRIERLIYAWFLDKCSRKDEILKLFDAGINGRNYITFKNAIISILRRRMSGEMNTSEGNGVMNMMMSFFLCEESGDMTYDGFFEGDDAAIGISSKPPTDEMYAELGANIKIDLQDNWVEGSFCGMIFHEEVYDNVSDPVEALMSFGYTTMQYCEASDLKLNALLRAKSFSLLYQYPGCPILRELALYGLRMTTHIDDRYMIKVITSTFMNSYDKELFEESMMARHNLVFDKVIDVRTRDLVERKFKITKEEQVEIELYLSKLEVIQPLEIQSFLGRCHADCVDYYSVYGLRADRNQVKHIQFSVKNHKPARIWLDDQTMILKY